MIFFTKKQSIFVLTICIVCFYLFNTTYSFAQVQFSFMDDADSPLAQRGFVFMSSSLFDSFSHTGSNVKREACRECGDSDLYPRQAYCKKCFSKRMSYLAKKKVRDAYKDKLIQNLDGEEWKEITDCPGYFISNYGRVKSGVLEGVERLLKQRAKRKNTYLAIDIDKYSCRPSVHRLVALYFVENDENKPIVNHKDGNKQNNHYTNLEWATRSENCKHAQQAGVYKKKLTAQDAIEIYNSIDTVQSLSDKYGVPTCTIWSIKVGRTWYNYTGATKNRDTKHEVKLRKRLHSMC